MEPELEEELLELEELLDEDEEELDEEDDEDEEDELNPDEDELLELEDDEDDEELSVPPQATRLSANRHELAIVTGRRQSTNVFIEDIFTYLFLVNTHCELRVLSRYKLFVIVGP